jgi:hypothetical protein
MTPEFHDPVIPGTLHDILPATIISRRGSFL